MQTWALANQKGGTGKTTSAINLAASLAAAGQRVLLIDLDPQAHATLGVGLWADEDHSVRAAFLAGVALSELVQTAPGGFHVVPSSPGLVEFEEVAERELAPERVLREALAPLAGRYDFALLDCPPRVDGALAWNAFRAAERTLLVVEAGAFALQGALRTRGLFAERRVGAGRSLRLLATLFDRSDALSREVLVAIQARFGAAVFDTVIRTDPRLREACAHGCPARILDPACRGALDYDALARELLEKEAPWGLLEPHPRRAARRSSPQPQPGSVSPSALRP